MAAICFKFLTGEIEEIQSLVMVSCLCGHLMVLICSFSTVMKAQTLITLPPPRADYLFTLLVCLSVNKTFVVKE